MSFLFTRHIALTFLAAIAAVVVLTTGSVNAQTRKPKTVANKPAETPASNKVEERTAEPAPTPVKRNERPGQTDPAGGTQKSGADASQARSQGSYKYEFSQPEFIVSSVKIEHDSNGNGTISFTKKGSDETITDPIRVSAKSITRINEALTSLNFLTSSEDYQYEKDYSHLGVIKFALSREGRSRDVSFSWTENKDAKILMDEYRKIGNQFIWVFDISLSRENQPLDAPRLFDSLDSMIRRNEISDPFQLEPFLRELSNDERIPLIARNHSSRLVAQFEKEKKKGSK